ncbi:MAG: WYL domain-containing protein [Eggerthellaceae bacterium]|nr:WYL domain-containing protein [Eggerthellaceae bacterium]
MDSLEPKKLALIRILQILQKYSDFDHLLKQEDIASILHTEYGIDIERKAIGRNLSLLKEAGFDIKSRHAGSYLDEREFTDSELRLLIDSVLSSKHITAKHSKDLIDKLSGLTSRYFRSHIKYVYSVNDWDKTENQEFFYNIDMIDEAIEQKRQIVFDYNKYGEDKKLHKTRSHQVSPYLLVLHNQHYYLMSHHSEWNKLAYFRLDRITDIRITDTPIVPVNTLKGFENGIDYKVFSRSMPYMYSDEPKQVQFLASEEVIDQVIDWFGKDISVKKYNEDTFKVTVTVSPNAMEHWALQYAGHVRVISPAGLIKDIENRLQTGLDSYRQNDIS